MAEPPYPIHESMVDRLDPEYVAFYNTYLIDKQVGHLLPLEEVRKGFAIPGPGPAPAVDSQDITIIRKESTGPDIKLRVFTPPGPKPEAGWPVMLYYHGGGWVLGNVDAENSVTKHLCDRGKCVVITTEYRLAPENVFPAAVHDCWETVLWVLDQGKQLLGLDVARMATGGSSAGGNLAAIITQRAAARNTCSFVLQLLIVPVADNTANTTNSVSWKENEHVPALSPARMLWFRDRYLPNKEDWAHPEASPMFWEGDWSKLPPAVLLLGELDILRSEGEKYGEKLRKAGIQTDVHISKGQPHPFIILDGVMEAGRTGLTILCEALAKGTMPRD
ncbi:hypothetical protein GQ53DRAFT_842522 [Thozetella sp. PMI_491]|nr:hypothetical protein GQ53DRAFT_842522 [Thozetella sp. PMI_491]